MRKVLRCFRRPPRSFPSCAVSAMSPSSPCPPPFPPCRSSPPARSARSSASSWPAPSTMLRARDCFASCSSITRRCATRPAGIAGFATPASSPSVLKQHGAELVLHGHIHAQTVHELPTATGTATRHRRALGVGGGRGAYSGGALQRLFDRADRRRLACGDGRPRGRRRRPCLGMRTARAQGALSNTATTSPTAPVRMPMAKAPITTPIAAPEAPGSAPRPIMRPVSPNAASCRSRRTISCAM